jgi:hypothetical protein
MSDETITLAIEPAAGDNWVGTKPPVPCNKPTGLCGYLNCKHENKCLQAPRVRRPEK